MLVIFYYMFKAGTSYNDLGSGFFDRVHGELLNWVAGPEFIHVTMLQSLIVSC